MHDFDGLQFKIVNLSSEFTLLLTLFANLISGGQNSNIRIANGHTLQELIRVLRELMSAVWELKTFINLT